MNIALDKISINAMDEIFNIGIRQGTKKALIKADILTMSDLLSLELRDLVCLEGISYESAVWLASPLNKNGYVFGYKEKPNA